MRRKWLGLVAGGSSSYKARNIVSRLVQPMLCVAWAHGNRWPLAVGFFQRFCPATAIQRFRPTTTALARTNTRTLSPG